MASGMRWICWSPACFPRWPRKQPSRSGRSISSEFLVAVPLHLVMSLLVGLLYGAMLPMLPRRPIVLGGFVAPLLWSGLIYGILAFVNPVMNQHIDWVWFVASQVAFGVVAGLVVVLQERIPTRQRIPLSVRMGIEAPGVTDGHQQERKQ